MTKRPKPKCVICENKARKNRQTCANEECLTALRKQIQSVRTWDTTRRGKVLQRNAIPHTVPTFQEYSFNQFIYGES